MDDMRRGGCEFQQPVGGTATSRPETSLHTTAQISSITPLLRHTQYDSTTNRLLPDWRVQCLPSLNDRCSLQSQRELIEGEKWEIRCLGVEGKRTGGRREVEDRGTGRRKAALRLWSEILKEEERNDCDWWESLRVFKVRRIDIDGTARRSGTLQS